MLKNRFKLPEEAREIFQHLKAGNSVISLFEKGLCAKGIRQNLAILEAEGYIRRKDGELFIIK